MLAHLNLVTLTLASLAALVYPNAGAPTETAQSFAARADPVCKSNSQVAFPRPGQVLKAGEPFEVVYCSGAYFKIRTLGVEAYLASGDDAATGVFGDVLGPLSSSSKYGQFGYEGKFSIPPTFQAGQSGFVYVQEKTTQYTTPGTSVNFFKVPVTIA